MYFPMPVRGKIPPLTGHEKYYFLVTLPGGLGGPFTETVFELSLSQKLSELLPTQVCAALAI